MSFAPLWLGRWKRHILRTISLDGWSEFHTNFIAGPLRRWPATDQTAHFLAVLRFEVPIEDSVLPTLKGTIRALEKRVPPSEQVTKQHYSFLLDPVSQPRILDTALRTLKQDMDPALDRRALLLMIQSLFFSIRGQARLDQHMYESIRKMRRDLQGLPPGLLEDDEAQYLQRLSADYFAYHALDGLRDLDVASREYFHADMSCCPDRVLQRTLREIQQCYLPLIERGDILAWTDLVTARIRFASRVCNLLRNGRLRSRVGNADYYITEQLVELSSELLNKCDDSRITFLNKYRVARYLWLFDDAIDLLEQFRNSPVSVDLDVAFSPQMIIDLMPLFLTPLALQSSFTLNTSKQRTVREFFLESAESELVRRPGPDILVLKPVIECLTVSWAEADWWKFSQEWLAAVPSPFSVWESIQNSLETEGAAFDCDAGSHVDANPLLTDLTSLLRLRVANYLALYGAGLDDLSQDLRTALGKVAFTTAYMCFRWDYSLRESCIFREE